MVQDRGGAAIALAAGLLVACASRPASRAVPASRAFEAVPKQAAAVDGGGAVTGSEGGLDAAPLSPADSMARLQASPLRLDANEIAAFERDGFVITERERQRTFADAWLAVYRADLPLFVSADALLHALHRSYDGVLEQLEEQVLAARLDAMLLGMRARLAGPEGQSLPATAVADADLLTTVALRLLEKEPVPPLVPSQEGAIAELVERAERAIGEGSASLFGEARRIDWSQFRPRGHYAGGRAALLSRPGHPARLADYFRATMWLGRTDVRIAHVVSGTYRLDRRQLDLALALRSVMGEPELAACGALEATMNVFVGPRDGMSPAEVDRLAAGLGAPSPREIAKVSDAKVLNAVLAGHYGEQRILSQLVPGDDAHHGLRDRVFLLTGQRYTPDADTLSALSYDRVQDRLMPDPLDIAYAVLGNDDAKPLLAHDIAAFVRPPAYGRELARVRGHFDAVGAALWDASLYTMWLGAVRALSPGGETRLPPAVAPAMWGRRILSSQLASWAELRHDTLLYAKQSYTSGIICSYPDALVDPYPAFYERIGRLAAKGSDLVRGLDFGAAGALRDRIDKYFDGFAQTAARLGAIARRQALGEEIRADDLAFVNGAITEEPPRFGGCGPPPREVHGWFVDLYFEKDPLTVAPTIADVHTQPEEQGGRPVGNVLHVGTGQPRLFVVNGGDRVHVHPYVGAVSTFAQTVVGNFQRYTDEEWFHQVWQKNPDDVPWMRDVVVR